MSKELYQFERKNRKRKWDTMSSANNEDQTNTTERIIAFSYKTTSENCRVFSFRGTYSFRNVTPSEDCQPTHTFIGKKCKP